jgi:hypothetical protein
MIPPRSRLADLLLRLMLDGNEPLIGDLVEESERRSTGWFWRQVVFAALVRGTTAGWASLREPHRLTGALAGCAIFVVLSFQAAVAGNLLHGLIQRLDLARFVWSDRSVHFPFVVLLSFAGAVAIGRGVRRVHGRSRVAAVLLCGAGAALAGALALSTLASPADHRFLPSVAWQTGAAMAFVVGLLMGGYRASFLPGPQSLESPLRG